MLPCLRMLPSWFVTWKTSDSATGAKYGSKTMKRCTTSSRAHDGISISIVNWPSSSASIHPDSSKPNLKAPTPIRNGASGGISVAFNVTMVPGGPLRGENVSSL